MYHCDLGITPRGGDEIFNATCSRMLYLHLGFSSSMNFSEENRRHPNAETVPQVGSKRQCEPRQLVYSYLEYLMDHDRWLTKKLGYHLNGED